VTAYGKFETTVLKNVTVFNVRQLYDSPKTIVKEHRII